MPALASMVYVHNWALFLCVGLAAATVLCARRRLKRFALVAVGVALLYLPWVPIVLSQVRHTGAPWSTSPGFRDLVLAPGAVVNGDAVLVALVLVGGGGLLALARRRDDDERTVVLALATVIAVTVALAWLSSQFSPAWTTRYFAVVLGPVLLIGARGLARADRRGLAALAVILFLWAGFSVRDDKENARQITAGVSRFMHPGELVVSTHPEQVPGAPLLPRPRVPLRDDDGAGARRPDLRLARCRWPAAGVGHAGPRSTRRSRRCGPAPNSWSSHPCFATTGPGMPPGRISSGRSRRPTPPRSSRIRGSACSTTSSTDEIALRHNYFKPLQAFVYRRVG